MGNEAAQAAANEEKTPATEKPAAEAAKAGETKTAEAVVAAKETPAKETAAKDAGATGASDAGASTVEKKSEAKEAPAKEAPPEKYELTLPKDSALPAQAVELVTAFAKEHGLTNKQAQSLLDRENTVAALQRDHLKTLNEGWVKELESDKEFGGEKFQENAELGKRVLDRFGDEQLKKGLAETNLGNHPALFRFFARIGRAMGEDSVIATGGGSGAKKEKKSTAERLYGGSSKK